VTVTDGIRGSATALGRRISVHREIYSRGEDITLANPFGGVARGWPEVSEMLEGGEWKLVHRHADTRVGPQTPESVIQ
jgi:hypothetical protein